MNEPWLGVCPYNDAKIVSVVVVDKTGFKAGMPVKVDTGVFTKATASTDVVYGYVSWDFDAEAETVPIVVAGHVVSDVNTQFVGCVIVTPFVEGGTIIKVGG